jgi:hypothetical protein
LPISLSTIHQPALKPRCNLQRHVACFHFNEEIHPFRVRVSQGCHGGLVLLNVLSTEAFCAAMQACGSLRLCLLARNVGRGSLHVLW